jgi:assimilatory nitrate reductase catalytic subunit
MATNPVVSMPDADRVRAALETCDLVVVSDMTANTDTAERAHVLLPATTWGEKAGTVTNSERRISRQRAFMAPPEMTRPDWWMICQVARRMGFQGFDYTTPAAIFREHASLSGLDNRGLRDFDISALSELDENAYEALAPVQWPVTPQAIEGTPRLFGSQRFFTPSGRARFVPTPAALPGQSTSIRYPLVLNTGRVRDHWHTMTRTAKSPRLSGHTAEPFVQVHPADASALGLQEGELAALRSRWGQALLRVRITDAQQAGSVFAPMHWSGQFAAQARVGSLINPCTDGLSGQPEFKHTPVALQPYRPRWHGFAMSRHPLEPLESSYWSRARRDGMWHYELAGETIAEDWSDFGQALLRREGTVQWSEMRDTAQNRYRAACFSSDKLEALVFVGPNHQLPARDWLARLFAKDFLEPEERARLLAGAPAPGNRDDAGCVVCSCHGVGRNTLLRAMREQNLDTVELLGEALGAGTNCGSCIPELRTLIQEATEKQMT